MLEEQKNALQAKVDELEPQLANETRKGKEAARITLERGILKQEIARLESTVNTLRDTVRDLSAANSELSVKQDALEGELQESNFAQDRFQRDLAKAELEIGESCPDNGGTGQWVEEWWW